MDKLVADDDSLHYNPVDLGYNDNGKKVLAVCKDHSLIVVNNLITDSTSFPSTLTYRTRNKWISELDICIASKELIPCVSYFNVNQDTAFPSNHAPVTVRFSFPGQRISLEQLFVRSVDIGTYPIKQRQLCKPPIRFDQVDTECFKEKITPVDLAFPTPYDHNSLAERFNDLLYTTLAESKKAPMHIEHPHDLSLSRWERILKCEDDGLLWKAIDWKGQFNPGNPDAESQPSESQFQNHLEKLLNPADEGILTDLSNHHTTITVSNQTIEVKEVKEVISKSNQIKVAVQMVLHQAHSSYCQVSGLRFYVCCSTLSLWLVTL